MEGVNFWYFVVQFPNNLTLTKNTHVVHTGRRLYLAQSQARNRSYPQLTQLQRNTGMTEEQFTADVFRCLLSSVPSQHPQTDTGVCTHSHCSSAVLLLFIEGFQWVPNWGWLSAPHCLS